jgi:hypothetical protein
VVYTGLQQTNSTVEYGIAAEVEERLQQKKRKKKKKWGYMVCGGVTGSYVITVTASLKSWEFALGSAKQRSVTVQFCLPSLQTPVPHSVLATSPQAPAGNREAFLPLPCLLRLLGLNPGQWSLTV